MKTERFNEIIEKFCDRNNYRYSLDIGIEESKEIIIEYLRKGYKDYDFEDNISLIILLIRQKYEKLDKNIDYYDAIDNQINLIKEIIETKNNGYASNVDKLSNFNYGAKISGKTAKEVCLGYMLKHICSVMDIINEEKEFSKETIEEKFNDFINYIILMYAIGEDY